MINSPHDKYILMAIVGFRKLVSLISNPPIQSIIDANLLPTILGLLNRQDIPRIQFEALWTLTNVASGKEEYVQALLDKGAVTIFIEIIKGDNQQNVKEQAIWALGNIAGDDNFFRNQIIKCKAFESLTALIQQMDPDTQFMRNSVWCLANLVRGKPMPAEEDMLNMIPVLAQILNTCSMNEILIDTMWCLSYCSDAGSKTVPSIMETGVVP